VEKDKKPADKDMVSSVKDGAQQMVGMVKRVLSLNDPEGHMSLKDMWQRTSDTVVEKADEAKRSVQLRVSIHDIENHLNRLYPDIGKTAFDLWSRGEVPLLNNKDLKLKLETAKEYSDRLQALRKQLSETNHNH